MSAARRFLLALVALASTGCVASLGAQGGTVATSGPLAGLPIVEIPASPSAAPRGDSGTIAIFISGDGGWADVDEGISTELAQNGIGVVGINSRAYLAHRKTPEQAAADVVRIARVYLDRWHARRLVLAGYSRGADMMPFIATRLPDDLRAHVALLAMFGLAREANFQFHWLDIIRDERRADDRPVLPELERLRGQRMLCVYGTKEKDSGCRDADPTLITRVARTGGHHFDGNFRALGDLVVGMLPRAAR